MFTTRKLAGVCVLALAASLGSTPASAQSIVASVFDTVVPFIYDQGRNVSVTDRQRLDYDPVGVQIGSFTLLPSVQGGAAYSDNVYQTTTAKVSDGFVAVRPSIKLMSDWEVNSLGVSATGNFVRYFKQTARDEDGWSVGANSRLSLDPYKFVSISARTGRYYEDQFVGAPQANLKSAVSAQSTAGAANIDVQIADLRSVIAGDFTHLVYSPVTTFANTSQAQTERNRDIGRIIEHVEYRISPDVMAFVEAVGTFTGYQTNLANGQLNRDSTEVRAQAGVSLDLAAKVRGNLAVGYIDRRYDAPTLYQSVKGFSLNARVEYFPSGLTSVTLAARRDIEDAVYIGAGGFFNNGVTLRVDHELYRNVLLNAAADYEYDKYGQIHAHAQILRASGGVDYMLNNLIGLNATVSYGDRWSTTTLIGGSLGELRAQIGIVLHR
jgi:hypothetical protein